MIRSLKDPIKGVLPRHHHHVATILHIGPVPLEALLVAWAPIEAIVRFESLLSLIAEVA